MKYTHKAWFGLCPIYMDMSGNIMPRYDHTDWLLNLSASIYGLLFKSAQLADPSFEPLWRFSFIRELKRPVVVDE